MPILVISLDFELFWGVAGSRTLQNYRGNVEGEWSVIPRLLTLFQKYGIHATWATVGMLMCRDHAQWREIRPAVLPGYIRHDCSTYDLEGLAAEYPRMFFARPLVEQIIAMPGQEVATHTYSHFYCGEEGATPEQFVADVACAQAIASDLGIRNRGFVFPRNQVRQNFVALLPSLGIQVYRGNPRHWIYANGHIPPVGIAGRAMRLADTWFPLTGMHVAQVIAHNEVVNVPASIFLRPWTRGFRGLEPLRLSRIKGAMTAAARSDGVCHLWWHPHNFGLNVEENIAALEILLKHFIVLRDKYGMQSLSMEGAAGFVDSNAERVEVHHVKSSSEYALSKNSTHHY